MSGQEELDNRENIVDLDVKEGVVHVRKPGTRDTKDFTFDAVYDATTIQSHFYDQTGYPVVESVLDGYNGTIFAYGQTGTGKTHTMMGGDGDLAGVIPRTFGHIFNSIGMTPNKKHLVRASYLEIYNEEIRDLLSKNPKQKLDLKDHPDSGVFVKDLSNLIVTSVEDLLRVMEVGHKNRSVASTLMNNESSRSHSIFTITVETAEKGQDDKDHFCVGKMNMVDLAGSERQQKTGSSGETLKEATKINMSLSALGNVISALVDAKTSFIPYRDSKLTRLLQDSLGGNTKTVMCACVGPVDYNYDETLSTLRYAYRAKSIKNKPKINEDPKDALLRELQTEIAQLKQKLADKAQGGIPLVPGAAGIIAGEQEVIVQTEVREVEQVVEKEVLVEKVVNVGITDADIANIQANVDLERQQVEAQFLAEQMAIEQQLNMAEEEKQRLLADIEERRRKRAEEQEAQELMLSQLREMEEKLLVGSQVMETAMVQENELRKAQIEVEERKREEKRMQEELEAAAEEKLNLEEKYASTEEQVSKLTMKLEKLWNRHKGTQQEIEDLQQEFQTEREDMLETIRDLRKEVKMVCLTIDSFIPMEQYQQIVERAQYDDSIDEWVIANVELAGNRLRPGRRRGEDLAGSPGSLLRGPEEQPAACAISDERPNVYFVYTEDGGAARAETRPSAAQKGTKNARSKSATRPSTANRKGRSVKTGGPAPAQAGAPAGTTSGIGGFLHGADMEAGDALGAYPKARGLVSAA